MGEHPNTYRVVREDPSVAYLIQNTRYSLPISKGQLSTEAFLHVLYVSLSTGILYLRPA